MAFVLCPSICSSLLARPEPLCSVLLVTLETRQRSHRQVYHTLSLDGIHPNRWQVGKLYHAGQGKSFQEGGKGEMLLRNIQRSEMEYSYKAGVFSPTMQPGISPLMCVE